MSFMTQTASFNYFIDPKYTVVEIPMKGSKKGGVVNKFTMILWIPEPFLIGEKGDAEVSIFTYCLIIYNYDFRFAQF